MPVSRVIETLIDSMLQNQKKQDVISNNLANVNTSGFKKDVAVVRSFPEMLQKAQSGSSKTMNLHNEVYHTNPLYDQSTVMHEIKTHHGQGDLRVTGNDLDVALSGKGFFAIETPNGIRYTRKGSFLLNSNRELVTQHGYRVLGAGGEDGEGVPIRINGTNVNFREDGTVQSDGITVGKLQIRDFADYDLLVKNGHSQYEYQGNREDITPVDDVSLSQGTLESSNVNAISEMTAMLTNSRHYEVAGRSLKQVETSVKRMITELPKMQ